MGVTQTLARFAVETPREVLPESATHILGLSLLDWIAVAIAGRDEPVARIVRDMVLSEGGNGEAGVVGSATRLPARAAALTNGATSHALDYDDTHFASLGHPSVAVFPAILALAEKTGASGTQALDAALIGAEAVVRVGVWLGRGHYEQGFHITGTAGAIGATAGCARLLGLDEERATHALGLASTRASGLKSQFGTMGKPYHAGLAAANAVEAVTLAAAGFVSRPDALETMQGFGATHAGEGNPLPEGRFIFEDVQHKLHACCHGTHATVEAMRDARAQGVAPGDATAITVTVHPRYLMVCNVAEPSTALEAKFSLRLTAAMALAGYDTASLDTFSTAACADPALVALRDRVTVGTDPALLETAADIAIETRAGEPRSFYHDIAAPLSGDARETKVRAKAATLLGQEKTTCIWETVCRLPSSQERFRLSDLL